VAVADNVRDATRLDGGRGFAVDEVGQVKRHIFVEEHRIHDYQGGFELRRFDSNPDMADAWLRLRGGRHLPEDVALLEHELAESRYWLRHPEALYDEAHAAANRVSNWESQIPAPTYENYADGW
jgi:hypothetical protein